MGRAEEFGGSQSPVDKYLSWSSDQNAFSFWNKNTEAKETLNLPYSFIVLKEVHTIVGWSDAHNAAIFANQIVSLKDDVLTVRIKAQPNPVAEGTYDEIKDKVKALGGKYAKVLYVFDGVEIHAITIKGAALTSYITFTNENRDAVKNNFITVKSFEEKKKGKTNYSEPIFTEGAKIEDDMSKTADEAYELVKAYILKKAPVKSDSPLNADSHPLPEGMIDELPEGGPFSDKV